MSTDREPFAGNWLTISNAFHQTISYNSVFVLPLQDSK